MIMANSVAEPILLLHLVTANTGVNRVLPLNNNNQGPRGPSARQEPHDPHD